MLCARWALWAAPLLGLLSCAAEDLQGTVVVVSLAELPAGAERLRVQSGFAGFRMVQNDFQPAPNRFGLRLRAGLTGNYSVHVDAQDSAGCSTGSGDAVVAVDGEAWVDLPVPLTAHAQALCTVAVGVDAGSGTVLSEPAGLRCGSACSGAFPRGSTLTLLAQPGADAIFGGWSGVCSGGDLRCSFTVQGPAQAGARFALDPCKSYPCGKALRAAYTASATDHWAVGDGGTVVRWQGSLASRATLMSPTSQDLYAISGSGPSDIWAVGAGGTLVRYDGAALSVLPVEGVSAPLYGVHVVSATEAYAVGAGGAALRLVVEGGTRRWAAVETGVQTDLFAVHGAGAAVWAVGQWGVVLSWNGTRFQGAALPQPAETLGHLFGVSVLGPDDQWFVGASGAWHRYAGKLTRISGSYYGAYAPTTSSLWLAGEPVAEVALTPNGGAALRTTSRFAAPVLALTGGGPGDALWLVGSDGFIGSK